MPSSPPKPETQLTKIRPQQHKHVRHARRVPAQDKEARVRVRPRHEVVLQIEESGRSKNRTHSLKAGLEKSPAFRLPAANVKVVSGPYVSVLDGVRVVPKLARICKAAGRQKITLFIKTIATFQRHKGNDVWRHSFNSTKTSQ